MGSPPSLRELVLGFLVPALFGLLVSVTIRQHSPAPGPAMTATVGYLMALAAIAFLLLLAQGRRISISPRLAVLLAALAVSATISVVGSGDIGLSQQRLQLYLMVFLVATAAYIAYRDSSRIPLEAFGLVLAVAHLPFLMAAIMWIADSEPPFWGKSARLAHFAHVRQYAEVAFFAAVGATAAGLMSARLAVPSLLLAAAALFGVVLTGSRGAFLSWLVFVLLMCVIGPARLRAVVHGTVVLAISTGLVWYLDRSGQLPSPNIFRRVASQVSGEASFDSNRLAVWGQSIRQIVARPLFGSGPEGYWISACCDRNILQAHNFVLQFLLEFGLVGCTIVVLLLARSIRRLGGPVSAVNLAVASPVNRVLAGILAAYFAYSLIDQMMYHLLPLLHFALFAGLLAAGLAQARNATPTAGQLRQD